MGCVSQSQILWVWSFVWSYCSRQQPSTDCFVMVENKWCSVCLARPFGVRAQVKHPIPFGSPSSSCEKDCRLALKQCTSAHCLDGGTSLPSGMHPRPWQGARVGRSFCLASLWSFNPAISVPLCKYSLLPPELSESVCPGHPLLSSRKGKAVWQPWDQYVSS